MLAAAVVVTAMIPGTVPIGPVLSALQAAAITAGCTARETPAKTRATDTTTMIRHLTPTGPFEIEIRCERPEEKSE